MRQRACASSESNTALTIRPANKGTEVINSSSSSSGTYTLSWTGVSGATRYQLNQSLNSGSPSAVYNAGGTSWSSSNLGNSSYAYQVYACNAAGCSAASNTVTVSVLHVPTAPASVTAPTLATVNVAFGVQWSAVSGATSYQLQQTESGARNAVTTPYSGAATSKVITLTGLVDDDFQYAARACNSAGCSGWTNAPRSTYLQRKGTQNAMPASGSTL